MKKVLLILPLILMFWSCDKANIPTPENKIKKSKMVNVLADLYLHQALLQNEVMNQGIEKYAQNAMSVLNHHEVTYEQFAESYKYYNSDPETFQDILNDAKDILVEQLSADAQQKRDVIIQEQKAQEEKMKAQFQ